MRSIASRSSRSSEKRTAVRSSRPPRSIQTGSRAGDHHLLDRRVGQQRLERPETEGPLRDPIRELGAGRPVEHSRLALDQLADAAGQVVARISRTREQAIAQVGGELVEVGHTGWRPGAPKFAPPDD